MTRPPLRLRVADRIVRNGRPGERLGVRLPEPEGGEMVWLTDGDAWDVFYRDPRRVMVVQHSMSPRQALRLAWFVIWRWWVKALWCGLRLRLWIWALHVRMEAGAATNEPVQNSGSGSSSGGQ